MEYKCKFCEETYEDPVDAINCSNICALSSVDNLPVKVKAVNKNLKKRQVEALEKIVKSLDVISRSGISIWVKKSE